ncbi:hypothetical protein N7527_001294 [Penicillium freii]|nr:hypothetical protein N7527_001294 [Penicillium freii]
MVDIQKEADSVLTGEQSQPIVVAGNESVVKLDSVFKLTLSALNIDRQNPLMNLRSLSEIPTVRKPQSAF